jgi:hypothetical protein
MDGMVASSSSAPAPASTSTSAPSASGASGKEKGKDKEPAEGTVDPSKQDFQAGIRAAFEKLKSSESGLKVRLSPSLLLPSPILPFTPNQTNTPSPRPTAPNPPPHPQTHSKRS